MQKSVYFQQIFILRTWTLIILFGLCYFYRKSKQRQFHVLVLTHSCLHIAYLRIFYLPLQLFQLIYLLQCHLFLFNDSTCKLETHNVEKCLRLSVVWKLWIRPEIRCESSSWHQRQILSLIYDSLLARTTNF